MSKESIYMNYVDALNRASKLEDTSQKLRSLARRMDNDTDEIMRSAWTGTASEAYYKKNKRMIQRIEIHARQLERTATALRSAAWRYYQTEMALMEIIGA